MANPPTPTARDLEVIVAVIEHSGYAGAAYALGIARGTVRWHLTTLYSRLGALNLTHAAAILWPILGDRYRLPPPARGRRPPFEPPGARG